MFILVILLSCLIIFAIVELNKSNSIIASINALWWSFFIVGGLLLFDTSSWTYQGLFYIVLCCFLLFIGEYVGVASLSHGTVYKRDMYLVRNNLKHNDYIVKQGNLMWFMLLVFIILGVLKVILSIFENGFSLSNFTNFSAFLEMNEAVAYERYYGSDTQESSMINQVLLVFCYLAPLCGGYSFLYANNYGERLIAIFCMFPVIFEMLYTNTKAGFIGSIFLWGIGFLLAYLEQHRCFIQIKGKILLRLCGLAFLIFVLLFLVMCFRIGDLSERTIDIVKDKIMLYAFGNIEAFEQWFSVRNQEELSFGGYTFLGIASKLGIQNREQGVYEFMEGISSNVFTVFRGVISDYGIWGGSILYFFFGIVSGISTRLVLYKQNRIAKVIWCSGMFFVLFSFASSPWTYMSYILVFPCFYFFLFFSKYSIQWNKKIIN